MSKLLSVVFGSLLLAPANADLNEWLTLVGQGTPSAFVSHVVAVPSVVNLGAINSSTAATYEFIVNSTLDGPSSSLMGTRNNGVSVDCALKFEQWNNTGMYGVTQAGVADWSISSTSANTDVHLCFVVDFVANTTTLYEDGFLVGSAPWAAHLAGDVGLGHWYNATGSSVDPLVGTIHGVAVYDQALPVTEILDHAIAFQSNTGIGGAICPGAVANSTGVAGVLDVVGSANAADNLLTLEVTNLPANEFGICIVAEGQVFIPNYGGSQGHLCVSPNFGIFSTQVRNTGASGAFSVPVDLTALPLASPVSVAPGETWYFQAWHRDSTPVASSNLTQGYYVVFQ